MNLKNFCDWPANRPMFVRNARVAVATPRVSVGRMTEHFGSFRLRNGHGSGMIRLFVKLSPALERSGNVNPFVGSTRGASGGATAAPALSDHVWKCIVSVGPMLIRIRRTSTLVARCASDGYRLF